MFSVTLPRGVYKHKKTIQSYMMGQKISSKLLFISSPNRDRFYRFILHKVQCSDTVIIRCIVCLVTTLVQIFHRICQWQNFENRSIFDKDMDKSLRLTSLGATIVFAG